MNPLVSFLIPTYNRSDLLRQAIESILSQNYKNIEIIVIDDASTDNTTDTINNQFKEKVSYYKNNINRGVAYSRNLGLSHATGKYIGLLDSDDILFEPTCVEIAVNVLESNHQIGVFTSDVYCIDLKGNRIQEKTFFQITIDHRDIELSSGIKDFNYVFLHGIHSCGTIFIRDITREIGFLNTDYKIGWDEDFFLRIAAFSKYKIYYHNAPLSAYRIHNSSFSSNYSELYNEKIKILYKIVKENRRLKVQLGKRFNKRIADQYYCLTDAYIKENKLTLSLMAALSAVIIYPPIFLKLISKLCGKIDAYLFIKRMN